MTEPIPHRRIVVFARTPDLGRVKTRLAAEIGAAAALAAYREMAAHALAAARSVPGAEVVVAYAASSDTASGSDAGAGDDAALRAWLGPGLTLRRQSEGDLGERMAAAFDEAFAAGVTRAVVIGTDCPSLGAHHLDAALDRLDDADVVLGPATDGGYYLVALARATPGIFRDIPWSSPETLAATLAAARQLGLRVALLEALADVDTADDWRAWLAVRAASPLPTIEASGR